MAVLVWGLIIVALAWIVHLIIWRIRTPVRQTRTLLLLFFGTYGCVLALLTVWAPSAVVPIPSTLPQHVQLLILVVAITLAYVITYSAIEADSPTLVMIRAIASAGEQGLEAAVLHATLDDQVLVEPRLRDLLRDKLATLDGESYRLTGKGRRFITIFVMYRALLGAGKGG